MRIERVEPSKHKKNRILVFLEGGQMLKITENELLHHDLRPGAELSEEAVEELQKSAQASQMKAWGAQLTGSRMLSKKQVVEHLTRRGGDREAAEDTALWLEELGAVDEAAYGAAIVRHYSASGYGPGRIRQELSHRGIPRDLWEELLSQMPPAEEAAEEAGASVLEQPFSRPRPAMPAAPAATFMKLRREMFAMMCSPFLFILLCLVLLLSRHIDCVFTNDVV